MSSDSDPFFVSSVDSQKDVKDPFFVKNKSAPEETSKEFLKRGIARTATRTAELPVNLLKGLQSIPENLLKGPLGKQIVQALRPISGMARYLPEQEEMEQFERKHTGEYLQPQTHGEKNWDELVKDTESMLFGPSGKLSGLTKLGRAAAISSAGIGAKEVAKGLGAGEEASGYTKLGTNLFLSMINPKAVNEMSGILRNKAISSVPEKASGNASTLETALKKIIEKTERTQDTAAKVRIRKEANGILDKIKNNELPYQQTIDMKTALNQNAESLYKDPEMTSKVMKETRAGFDDIRSALKDYIKQSEKEYPEFYNNITKSDEVYSAMANSNKVRKFLGKHGKTLKAAGVIGPVIELFTAGPAATVGTLGVIGTGGAAVQGLKFANRISKSPTLREHYIKALEAASKENVGSSVQEIQRFNEEARKDPELKEFFVENR